MRHRGVPPDDEVELRQLPPVVNPGRNEAHQGQRRDSHNLRADPRGRLDLLRKPRSQRPHRIQTPITCNTCKPHLARVGGCQGEDLYTRHFRKRLIFDLNMRIDELNCKQRVAWIDCLKTLAIFLVLWGHCIQLLQNGEMHWNNDVYSFIYGFHMPLFMAISGFFSKNLLKLDITSLLRKKGIQFLFPVIVWGSLAWGLDTFGARTSGMSIQYAIVFRYLWFLKSIFICVCLFYFAFKICKGLGGGIISSNFKSGDILFSSSIYVPLFSLWISAVY